MSAFGLHVRGIPWPSSPTHLVKRSPLCAAHAAGRLHVLHPHSRLDTRLAAQPTLEVERASDAAPSSEFCGDGARIYDCMRANAAGRELTQHSLLWQAIAFVLCETECAVVEGLPLPLIQPLLMPCHCCCWTVRPSHAPSGPGCRGLASKWQAISHPHDGLSNEPG